MKDKTKETSETKEVEEKVHEDINETAKKVIEEHEKKEEVKLEEKVDPTIELNKTINIHVEKIKEQEGLISKLTSIITNGNQTGETKKEPEQDIKTDFASNVAKDMLNIK